MALLRTLTKGIIVLFLIAFSILPVVITTSPVSATVTNALVQCISGSTGGVALTNSATRYYGLAGYSGAQSSSLTSNGQLIAAAGKLTNFRVALQNAPGDAKSFQFVLMYDGSTSTLDLTLTGAATTTGVDTDNVTVAAGKTVEVKVVPSGTPTAGWATWCCDFVSADYNTSLILGMGYTNTAAGNNFWCIDASSGSGTNPLLNQVIIPTPGVIGNFYVQLSGSSGCSAGQGYRMSLWRNGAETALAVTITGSTTTGNDTTHSIRVAAGDIINFGSTLIGTMGTNRNVYYGATFTADSVGESLVIGFVGDYGYTSSATTYWTIMGGSNGGNATETLRQNVFNTCTLKKLYVWSNIMVGTGQDTAFSVRANASSPANTLSVGLTSQVKSAGDTTNTVAVTAGDLIDLRIISTGSPTTGIRFTFSCVCYTATDIAEDAPSIDTDAATGTTSGFTTLNGEVTNLNGSTVTVEGFDYDTDSGAPYANSWTQSSFYSTGVFSYQVTGLEASTTYYFRAKAYNSNGWEYGSELTVTTSGDYDSGYDDGYDSGYDDGYAAGASSSTGTVPLAPTNFSLDGIDDNLTALLSWTVGDNATGTIVVTSLSGYPSSVSDGDVVYYGEDSLCSVPLNMYQIADGGKVYFSAFSYNGDNISTDYATVISDGGSEMTNVAWFFVAAILGAILTVLGYRYKRWYLAVLAAVPWIAAAVVSFDGAEQWSGIWWLGILSFIMILASLAEPIVMRGGPLAEDEEEKARNNWHESLNKARERNWERMHGSSGHKRRGSDDGL